MLMNIRKSMQGQKGFTLVELMVVIAIIGVLAAIAVPMFTDSTDSAKTAKSQADKKAIESALQLYYADNSKYPTAADYAALGAILAPSSGKKYMKEMPSAPSGYTAYTYVSADGSSYTLAGGTK